MSFSFYFGVPTDLSESTATFRATTIISKYLSEDELAMITLSVERGRVKVDSSQAILWKLRKGLDSESPVSILGGETFR